MATAIGAITKAARVGDSPHTACVKNISGNIIAVAANAIMATPTLQRLKSRSLKMSSGISGSRVLTACQ